MVHTRRKVHVFRFGFSIESAFKRSERAQHTELPVFKVSPFWSGDVGNAEQDFQDFQDFQDKRFVLQ